MFSASGIDSAARSAGLAPGLAGLLGGIGWGGGWCSSSVCYHGILLLDEDRRNDEAQASCCWYTHCIHLGGLWRYLASGRY